MTGQLDAVGLFISSAQFPVESVKMTQYTRRTALKNALVCTNQGGQITPMGDVIFATAVAVHQKSSICNYSVSLITCSGTVPGAGSAGVDVFLTYMFIDEMKIWTERYLTGSFDDNKDSSNLIAASRTDRYPIDTYYEFAPKSVLGSNVHQVTYYNKHKATYATRTNIMNIVGKSTG